MLTVYFAPFGDRERGTAFVLNDHPAEIDPDVVFLACNRVEDLDTDLRRMLAGPSCRRWAALLRRQLDRSEQRSMMSGDWVFVTSASGEELGGWQVKPIGFDRRTGSRLRADTINNAHLVHVD